jgi:hypothetical protein
VGTHKRVPFSQYVFDDDDSESLHSHASIYIDTASMRGASVQIHCVPEHRLQQSPKDMIDQHVKQIVTGVGEDRWCTIAIIVDLWTQAVRYVFLFTINLQNIALFNCGR